MSGQEIWREYFLIMKKSFEITESNLYIIEHDKITEETVISPFLVILMLLKTDKRILSNLYSTTCC